ncbi:nucleoid-associated protein NdpA [Aquimarina aggregata]|uniref:Nucleoid-associated protein NdpA n=1 Tax=Aquimarina aggregata TaxID=1642818 RepID=A0A162DKQ0_9FLAO|nr:nucleoid-associated protein [Aquimarina aggregata]KZS41878.1 nucleoid-associated protein NdpA [Aquimarina aggregata]
MLNLYNTQIESFSVHMVGNKSKNGGLFISDFRHNLNDELTAILKEYLFKPFREKEENYFKFTHDIDLEFNVLYNIAGAVFDNPDLVHEKSRDIARHLFEQSNHPHIKGGEIYVAYLENITIDNEKVSALGIFKSEIKQEFLQFSPEKVNDTSSIDLLLQQGVNLNRLDKGCLIFNTKGEEGYKVLSIDANKYDTKYWLDSFLGVEEFEDDHFYTKRYLKFCQDFAKDVVLPSEDKKQEVMFMNRAVNHFASNDDFEESAFLNEVIDNPDLVPEFKHYKVEKAPKYSIEDLTTFPIADKAVSDARKKIKSIINLDTNVQIKMDFINPESAERFIEKGWDQEKEMYYYLVYFNKEVK